MLISHGRRRHRRPLTTKCIFVSLIGCYILFLAIQSAMKSVAIIGEPDGGFNTFWQPQPRQTTKSTSRPSLSSSPQQNVQTNRNSSAVEEDDYGSTTSINSHGPGAKQLKQQPNKHINETVTQQNHSRLPTSRRRVVILPGPHKTASSSIQFHLLSWLNNTNDDIDPSGLIGKDWVWPTPIDTIQKSMCIIFRKNYGQEFYWLINSLMDKNPELPCLVDGKVVRTKFDNTPEFIDIYRKEFYDMWMKGKNLVIATEAMDFVASEKPSNHPDRLLGRFIHLLPWNYHPTPDAGATVGDITVVVVYRGLPRSSHLISIWHQCCMRGKTRMSFYEYVTDPNWLQEWYDPLMSIDSLKLAKKFLEKGFRVILIDMAGVQAKGYDISNVIACDILEADCTNDKQFIIASSSSSSSNNGGSIDTNNMTPTATKKASMIKNAQTHFDEQLNVTSNQLKLIDNVIERYDCNYVSLLDDKNFHVLYSYALKKVFQKCNNNQNISSARNTDVSGIDHRVVNRKNMVKEIRGIFDV